MRIAQVVSSYYPHIGGVETHVQHLAEECARANDQISVLTHQVKGWPTEEWIGPVRVYRFPLTVDSNNYPLSWSLVRYLNSHAANFDIVHAHSYHTLAAHAAVNTSCPFVFTPHYHGTGHSEFRKFLHSLYRPVGARLFRAADAVICVSNAERALVVEDFPRVASKVVTIPNGTDRIVASSVDPWASRRDPLVLVVGRLERYKNVDLVIKSFRALPSPATMIVVGDGPDRARLERRAAEPGWPVVIAGTISNTQLSTLFLKATVVAAGSDHEAFGMTLASGLAAGARVVASNIAAHREVAQLAGPGAPVVLVDPRDSRRLTQALAAALAAGRGQAGEVQLPSWEEVVSRTRELYKLTISNGVRACSGRLRNGIQTVRSSIALDKLGWSAFVHDFVPS